jgi:sigma-B regulation protein RsbU (phosphoserine phosphatase)
MVSLRPGDMLVAYTDGLCDTTSRVGEEWGWQRFLKTVEDCSDQRARDIVEGVIRTAEAFAGGAPQHDDVTLFVGRVQNSTAVRPYREAERVQAVMAAAA